MREASDKSQRPKARGASRERSILLAAISAGRLKLQARRGWELANLSRRRFESVADHSWRVALLACLAAPAGLRSRAVELALVHDLPEAECGDITPSDRVSRRTKLTRERRGLETVLADLGPSDARRIRRLWLEYDAGRTEEALLVGSLDKLEMAMQALEYERGGEPRRRVARFWRSARVGVRHTAVKALFEELVRLRAERPR